MIINCHQYHHPRLHHHHHHHHHHLHHQNCDDQAEPIGGGGVQEEIGFTVDRLPPDTRWAIVIIIVIQGESLSSSLGYKVGH